MIYVARQQGRPFIKIGFTDRDIEVRLREWNTGSVEPIEILLVLAGGQPEERALHVRFKDYRVRGNAEWFRLAGALLEWVETERQRSDEDRARELEADETAYRFHWQRLKDIRRLQRLRSYTARFNAACAALAFGRFLLRSTDNPRFGAFLERTLEQIEQEARALRQEHGLSSPRIPPRGRRMEQCRDAWLARGLPDVELLQGHLEWVAEQAWKTYLPFLAEE